LEDLNRDGGQCGPRYQAFRREKLEEIVIKKGRMEEAFEEGQGPHRAVEPVVMMIVTFGSTL
jgi:hypothetical protein